MCRNVIIKLALKEMQQKMSVLEMWKYVCFWGSDMLELTLAQWVRVVYCKIRSTDYFIRFAAATKF